jgi:hypothetical protein
MAQESDQVSFALQQLAFGLGWLIVATHPSGQQEHILGFHSEDEAKRWLEGSRGLRSWFKTRGYKFSGRGGGGTTRLEFRSAW